MLVNCNRPNRNNVRGKKDAGPLPSFILKDTFDFVLTAGEAFDLCRVKSLWVWYYCGRWRRWLCCCGWIVTDSKSSLWSHGCWQSHATGRRPQDYEVIIAAVKCIYLHRECQRNWCKLAKDSKAGRQSNTSPLSARSADPAAMRDNDETVPNTTMRITMNAILKKSIWIL